MCVGLSNPDMSQVKRTNLVYNTESTFTDNVSSREISGDMPYSRYISRMNSYRWNSTWNKTMTIVKCFYQNDTINWSFGSVSRTVYEQLIISSLMKKKLSKKEHTLVCAHPYQMLDFIIWKRVNIKLDPRQHGICRIVSRYFQFLFHALYQQQQADSTKR
jgi:hypothetical protein